jgi:uncharacterized protein
MGVTPQILTAKIMHKRFFPKVNSFIYGAYYLFLPLSQLYKDKTVSHLAVNKFGLLSFYEKDHGAKNGAIDVWIRNVLAEHSLNDAIDDIVLICMPRVLGYVFNPVSFWLCLDKNNGLRAVLCEVNNTFGETHSYLCTPTVGDVIHNDDWLEAKKLFHVSPFLNREGHYKFRFSRTDTKLGIWIDFYNADNQKQLVTSLIGNLEPLTQASLRTVFLKYPLITFKTIVLIHWQALKLMTKGIKYITKPKQIKDKLTTTKI